MQTIQKEDRKKGVLDPIPALKSPNGIIATFVPRMTANYSS